MKPKFPKITILSLLSLSWITMAQAQKVHTDYDHKVNFSQYKTDSWGKVETSNSIWDSRVRDAVNKALTAKGLTEVPSGGDITVVAMATTREKPTLQTFYDNFDGWSWQGFGTATTTVETYKVGTLIVDLFDTNTKRLIWRGSGTETVSGDPEKNTKKLEKEVEKMFSHFPPKPNK